MLRRWVRPSVALMPPAGVPVLESVPGNAPMPIGFSLARLRWMLCEAYSPYGHHRSPAHAEQLVRDFVHELPGQGGSAWSFASVQPDFLRSTGYYNREEPLHPAYFDGSGSDTATFLDRGLVCYLLLTNGSP